MDLGAMGERIRSRRELLRLTQRDVAVALQVSGQAVSKWERGENAPDLSILVSLSHLLGVSTDWLLGSYAPDGELFEATVLATDLVGFGARSERLHPRDAATWLNGQFFQITELALRHDGVPVKYVGDMALCFFAGSEHRRRAVRCALALQHLLQDSVRTGLSAGSLYLGTIGHPDYAARDIVGQTVNVAVLTCDWARHTPGQAVATESVLDGLADEVTTQPHEAVALSAALPPITLHVLRGETSSQRPG